MAKLIIGVDIVGVRAVVGPVVGAAVLFDASTVEPRFEVATKRGVQRFSLLDPKKIPELLAPHVVTHIKKIALSFACVNIPGSVIANARSAGWLAMGQAAARAMERATHLRRDALDVALTDLEIFIPPGGHCPYDIVGQVGQRPAVSNWRRGAAYMLARVAQRDLLHDMDDRFPGYDFFENQGNLTRAHQRAIRRLGRSPEHRGD